MTTVTFEIKIGDWSGDGHGHCEAFRFVANKTIEQVREAYFAACAKFASLNPENFCEAYDDSGLPTETRARLREAGFPLRSDESLDDEEALSPQEMAEIVAWFCMKGDADLKIEIVPVQSVPMLSFYGYDKKGRHIGSHGYGLFH